MNVNWGSTCSCLGLKEFPFRVQVTVSKLPQKTMETTQKVFTCINAYFGYNKSTKNENFCRLFSQELPPAFCIKRTIFKLSGSGKPKDFAYKLFLKLIWEGSVKSISKQTVGYGSNCQHFWIPFLFGSPSECYHARFLSWKNKTIHWSPKMSISFLGRLSRWSGGHRHGLSDCRWEVYGELPPCFALRTSVN